MSSSISTAKGVPPALATAMPLPYPSLAGQLYPAIDALEYYLKATVVAIERLPVWDNHRSPHPELLVTLDKTKRLRDAWCAALWDELGVLWLNSTNTYAEYHQRLSRSLAQRHAAELETVCGSQSRSALHPQYAMLTAHSSSNGGNGINSGLNDDSIGTNGGDMFAEEAAAYKRQLGGGPSSFGGGAAGAPAAGSITPTTPSLSVLMTSPMQQMKTAGGGGVVGGAASPFFPQPPSPAKYFGSAAAVGGGINGVASASNGRRKMNTNVGGGALPPVPPQILAMATAMAAVINPNFARAVTRPSHDLSTNPIGPATTTFYSDPTAPVTMAPTEFLLATAATNPPTTEQLEHAVATHLASHGFTYDLAADIPPQRREVVAPRGEGDYNTGNVLANTLTPNATPRANPLDATASIVLSNTTRTGGGSTIYSSVGGPRVSTISSSAASIHSIGSNYNSTNNGSGGVVGASSSASSPTAPNPIDGTPFALFGKITRLVLKQIYERSVLDTASREHSQLFARAKAHDRVLLSQRLDRFTGMLMLVTDAVESKIAAGSLPEGVAGFGFAGDDVVRGSTSAAAGGGGGANMMGTSGYTSGNNNGMGMGTASAIDGNIGGGYQPSHHGGQYTGGASSVGGGGGPSANSPHSRLSNAQSVGMGRSLNGANPNNNSPRASTTLSPNSRNLRPSVSKPLEALTHRNNQLQQQQHNGNHPHFTHHNSTNSLHSNVRTMNGGGLQSHMSGNAGSYGNGSVAPSTISGGGGGGVGNRHISGSNISPRGGQGVGAAASARLSMSNTAGGGLGAMNKRGSTTGRAAGGGGGTASPPRFTSSGNPPVTYSPRGAAGGSANTNRATGTVVGANNQAPTTTTTLPPLSGGGEGVGGGGAQQQQMYNNNNANLHSMMSGTFAGGDASVNTLYSASVNQSGTYSMGGATPGGQALLGGGMQQQQQQQYAYGGGRPGGPQQQANLPSSGFVTGF